MSYKKYEVPLLYGGLTGGNSEFFGLSNTDNEEYVDFVLWDLERNRGIQVLRANVYTEFNTGEVFRNETKCLSGGSGLFAGAFATDKDDNIIGYNVEEYDSNTGKLVSVIPISRMWGPKWKLKSYDDQTVCDAVRISSEEVLIAVLDNRKYEGAAFDIVLYNSETDSFSKVGRATAESEDIDFFYDLRFDKSGRKLFARLSRYDCKDSPYMNMLWENHVFNISKELDYIEDRGDEITTSEGMKSFIDETLLVEYKEGSLFKKGSLKITERTTGRVLIDEVITKNDRCDTMAAEDPRILVVCICDKKFNHHVVVLHHSGFSWDVTERLDFDNNFIMHTDLDHGAVILQDGAHSVLLVADNKEEVLDL